MRGRKRRMLAALAGALLLAGPLAAQEGGSHAIALHGTPKYGPDFQHFDYADPNAPKGGEVKLMAMGGFDNLNPFILRGQTAAGATLVFETLTVGSSDEAVTEYGLLAESIAVAEDRSWVSFTLRPQARFNDGKPVTADDVIWSFQTLKEKGHPIYRTYYADVVKAEKTGERTVKFSFKGTDNAELPVIMGQLPVLPKHVFDTRPFESTTLEPLVGSGPYVVAEVQPGRSITYQRVADWWGKDLPLNRGRYNFDRLRYDYYRDLDVGFEAFKAGAFDFRLENSSKNWTTGYNVPAVKDGQIVREELKHQDPQGMQAFVLNLRRPVFQDRRVREGAELPVRLRMDPDQPVLRPVPADQELLRELRAGLQRPALPPPSWRCWSRSAARSRTRSSPRPSSRPRPTAAATSGRTCARRWGCSRRPAGS
ncbi:extracellular solute-binding protein [Azospirillum doebereinerae]|uniref:extracellular solute-binding protein n=1 Tax=Azospirillum doebereinerae TaxID=92933 RepID=UPI00384B1351